MAKFKMFEVINAACDKYSIAQGDRGLVNGTVLAVLPHVPRPLHTDDNKPLVELKINEELAPGVQIQGTIDDIQIGTDGSRLVVDDWKTTGYMTMGPVIEKYRFSIQIPFYLYTLEQYKEKYLPSKYRDLPIYGKYIIIQYKKSPVVVQSTQLIHAEHGNVVDLIQQSHNMIRVIEDQFANNILALPIGRTSNQCKECRFNNICFAKDVLQAIEAAPKEDYNPMTFR